MSQLPWPARLYVATLTLTALGLTLVALAQAKPPSSEQATMALAFGGLMTVAWLFPLPFSFKTKLYFDTSVLVAATLLFEPGMAMLIAGGGTALAHAIRREDGVQATFNSAQVALQTAAGGFVLARGGWHADHPLFSHPGEMPLIVVAAAVMWMVNHLSVATVVGLQSGVAPLRVWYQAILNADRVEHLAQLAQVGIGLLAAVLADTHLWTLSLLVPPAGLVYRLLARNVALQRRVERGRPQSQETLAEAQRVARLGSWDWNLATGEQLWSEEVYRLFGFAPHAFVPTYATFLRCIHPDDRPALDQSVHDALYEGKPFSIDHRIQLPDGGERTVHEQGEVVFDDLGRKVRMVGTVHDITERKALEAQLAHQAFHDPLTDLPNRALFVDRLAHALVRARPQGASVGVLFMDLDRFKFINDSFGHHVGDEVLIAVAGRLRTCVRLPHTVARHGGDEFTILLEEIRYESEATGLAERIMEAFRAPLTVTDQRVFITASIGIALSTPSHRYPTDLLRDADVALYHAKAKGKARYQLLHRDTGAAALKRVNMQVDLERALERDELRLQFQPKVELATGRIVAMEALVRWQHPERGLIFPPEFIPLAEKTGLILPIGRWTLTEACRQGKMWQERWGTASPAVTANLSARQLQHPDLVADVTRILRETELTPRLLTLEITESVAMEDTESTTDTLWQLRGIGVQAAIDDFGTGYSSLSRLQQLPVEMLKLDKSFVARLEHDAAAWLITQAVISLGHALDLRVVAEGVETAEQVRHLRDLGCHLGQGYYFARPLTNDGASALLEQTIAADPEASLVSAGTLFWRSPRA